MEQGPPFWMFLVAFGFLLSGIVYLLRNASWKAKMDDRLSGVSLAPDAGSSAIVSVYRQRRYVGALGLWYICCDDKPIARLKNGRYATARVPAGEHEFKTLDSDNTPISAPFVLTLEPRQEVFLKCSHSVVDGYSITMIDCAEARREMAALRPAERP